MRPLQHESQLTSTVSSEYDFVVASLPVLYPNFINNGFLFQLNTAPFEEPPVETTFLFHLGGSNEMSDQNIS